MLAIKGASTDHDTQTCCLCPMLNCLILSFLWVVFCIYTRPRGCFFICASDTVVTENTYSTSSCTVDHKKKVKSKDRLNLMSTLISTWASCRYSCVTLLVFVFTAVFFGDFISTEYSPFRVGTKLVCFASLIVDGNSSILFIFSKYRKYITFSSISRRLCKIYRIYHRKN